MPGHDLLMLNGKGGFSKFVGHHRTIRILWILPGTDQDQDYVGGIADTVSIPTGLEYPVRHTQKRSWQNMTRQNTHIMAVC